MTEYIQPEWTGAIPNFVDPSDRILKLDNMPIQMMAFIDSLEEDQIILPGHELLPEEYKYHKSAVQMLLRLYAISKRYGVDYAMEYEGKCPQPRLIVIASTTLGPINMPRRERKRWSMQIVLPLPHSVRYYYHDVWYDFMDAFEGAILDVRKLEAVRHVWLFVGYRTRVIQAIDSERMADARARRYRRYFHVRSLTDVTGCIPTLVYSVPPLDEADRQLIRELRNRNFTIMNDIYNLDKEFDRVDDFHVFRDYGRRGPEYGRDKTT